MNEEIIIDGVNVVECNFLLEREGKQKCESSHATGFGVICDCDKWHNCYYKQLKRLEQENARYKQTLQEIKAIVKENISYQDTDSTTRAMTKILDL